MSLDEILTSRQPYMVAVVRIERTTFCVWSRHSTIELHSVGQHGGNRTLIRWFTVIYVTITSHTGLSIRRINSICRLWRCFYLPWIGRSFRTLTFRKHLTTIIYLIQNVTLTICIKLSFYNHRWDGVPHISFNYSEDVPIGSITSFVRKH